MQLSSGSSQSFNPPVSGNFINRQGLRIFTWSWKPNSDEAKGVVIIVHGFSEHCGRYTLLAESLQKAGFAVEALDHQGHGRSEGVRGHVERFADYVEDVIAVAVHRCDQRIPTFLVAHSMGGNIAVHVAASGRIQNLSGVVLSAPAILLHVNKFYLFLLRCLSKLCPKLALFALPAQLISRDRTVVKKYLEDPLVYRGGLRVHWICESVDASQQCCNLARQRGSISLLCLHGGEDRLVNPASSSLIHAAWAGPKRIEILPGDYHEIFNEPSHDSTYQLVVDWLKMAAGNPEERY